jgi:hypothetical protein
MDGATAAAHSAALDKVGPTSGPTGGWNIVNSTGPKCGRLLAQGNWPEWCDAGPSTRHCCWQPWCSRAIFWRRLRRNGWRKRSG